MNEITPNLPLDTELQLFERDEAGRSVLDLIPTGVHTAVVTAAAKRRELFFMDESTLYKTLRSDNGTGPNPTDNRLRLKFWDEYDKAQAQTSKMNMGNVYLGVCSAPYFYQRFLMVPEKVAWMMCVPANYAVKMEEALAFGIEQMRDILAQPHVLPNGKVDSKLAELKAKIVAMMDIRVKGATVQKIEQKNMNLNVMTTDADVARRITENTMEGIEKKLKELELRDRKAALFAEQKKVELLDD